MTNIGSFASRNDRGAIREIGPFLFTSVYPGGPVAATGSSSHIGTRQLQLIERPPSGKAVVHRGQRRRGRAVSGNDTQIDFDRAA